MVTKLKYWLARMLIKVASRLLPAGTITYRKASS